MCFKIMLPLFILFFSFTLLAKEIETEKSSGNIPASESMAEKNSNNKIVLGINTADVREDTSSVQFLNLFSSAIPFADTVPWASSKKVKYDKYGWPTDLKGGQAGTKFLNRLPDGTVEDGFFTVLYDGEGEIFYGNDARLVVHRPNKDVIEIRSGKDKILNASLFIKKSNPENYLRNIRILPEGGVCKGALHYRVKTAGECGENEYLSFEDNHFNPWAVEQREKAKLETQKAEEDKTKGQTKNEKTENLSNDVSSEEGDNEEDEDSSEDDSKEEDEKIEKEIVVKGISNPADAIIFNPEYLNFMKDFQVVRFMNMSGMTRNPVKKWKKRNRLKKASWGGKYGSRGAPVEIMVALANQIQAYPWFSMPYKAGDGYIRKFGEYVNENLDQGLKSYIEYSNEVWNPIFSHHDYAIAKGKKARLDKKKSKAGYKWYSKRSVETFKLWEKAFSGTDRLIRVMGSWASNQIMTSTVLKYKNAYKYTDAVAIGPYFSANPRVLRRAKTVDDVFKAILSKRDKWSMDSTVNYINKQAKVAQSFGVDLVAYEGGQHLVDWNTRKADEHPNQLLYAANRDPRMGILYDELLREWNKAGAQLFVAFSAPRIYSWYGSWGIKEHIRQPREEAPKYDSLLRYLNASLYPEKKAIPPENEQALTSMSQEQADFPIAYVTKPQMIWDMSSPQVIPSKLSDNSSIDFSASWQAKWDSKNLYLSVAVNDDNLEKGDELTLTLDITSGEEVEAKLKEQDKKDIETEKELLAKKKKEQEERRKIYEARAKAKELAEADEKKKKEEEQEKEQQQVNDKQKTEISKRNEEDVENKEQSKEIKISDVDTKATKVDIENTDKKNTKKLEDRNTENKPKDDVKTDNESFSAVQKSIEEELKKALKNNKKTKASESEKLSKNEETQSKKIEDVTEEVNDTESEIIEIDENVKTLTFTPHDEPDSRFRSTISDNGYLLNLTLPWSDIYSDKKLKILAKMGDKIGINIVITDYDKDEKGSKELRLSDGSDLLPKIALKNRIIEK